MDRKRTLKWLWSLLTSSKSFPYHVVVAVQWPSCVRLFATPWTAACQASLSLTISQSLPKFMFIALVMPSFPSTLDLSQHPMSHLLTTDDQNSGASGFSIGPSREYSWLISLKIDWFDFLTVQGTFRSLLYHPSLKASILWRSAFLIVQLSQLYVTTGKTIAWKDLCQQNNVAGFQHTV